MKKQIYDHQSIGKKWLHSAKATRGKQANYDHRSVESKWQKKWLEEKIYHPSDMLSVKEKFYNLWMFPYPSAEGMHAGTIFASTGSDIYGRFMRMSGHTVFQPVGYDSFGIHAENFAIKRGQHPHKILTKTLKNYERQFKQIGHGYDWTRTVTTSDIHYYRWTQWIFIEMFKAGLAYRKKATVNWCPSCKTVLADEQVMSPKQAGKEPKRLDGKAVQNPENVLVCERCGTVAEKRDLEQWFFRITDYADKLLANLSKIDWPEKIKIAQTNWIGKKEGINVTYPIKHSDKTITVWTSRPDTNFGATFIVVAPEYAKENLIQIVSSENIERLEKYIKKSLSKSKDDRIKEGREKTGEFTGLYAINQLNGYEMPIWLADFVLADVGTGAVVGVPGHDKRDFEFAKEFSLPVIRVVVGSDKDSSEITRIDQVQEEEGIMINSGFLNGLDIHEAISKMIDHLEDKGWGKRTTTYHLRDWLISRQRYWGPPIPMIYCQKCAKDGRGYFSFKGETLQAVLHPDQSDWNYQGWYPEEKLPVELPDIPDYQPEGNGRGPLAKHPEFYQVACPSCGSEARRETDVSDTFLDSAWYHMRYPSTRSARSGQVPFDSRITKKWLPVDLYFGGAEHSVLHLMYARFIGMFFHDLGLTVWEEPYPRFYAHGLVIKDGAKMSKSRGNVVNPDEYIEKFGADTLRLYLMFMGPMDGYPDFRDTGIEGMRRFIDRVWQLFQISYNKMQITYADEKTISIKMHQTIKKVTEDIQNFRYNTAISAIMEYVNLLQDAESKSKISNLKSKSGKSNQWHEAMKTLALLLAPFAPHTTEEVWVNVLGQKFSIHKTPWPSFDPELIKASEVTIAVQVNGKLRGTITLASNETKDKDFVIRRAKSLGNVSKWLEGKKIRKEIFVPGELVNFVV